MRPPIFAQRPLFLVIAAGLFIGAIAGLVSGTATMFWVSFAPFAIVGLLFRRGEPPFLLFALWFQWMAISAGYFSFVVKGYSSGYVMPGDWDRAVTLSICGLLMVTLGIYVVIGRKPLIEATLSSYSPQRLFIVVIVLYSLDWIVILSRFILGAGFAQIVVNVLLFRDVFLFLLLWQVFRNFRGVAYAIGAALFVLVPQLASAMSQFKSVLFMSLLAFIGLVTSKSISQVIRRRLIAFALIIGLATLLAGLFWEGAFKPIWRPAAMADAVGHTPMERVESFLSYLEYAAEDFNLLNAVDDLTSRLSGATIYFSNVLVRVPALIDYEHGALTRRAIIHVLVPRLFDPGKATLGSDSWLVNYYAGVAVAGEEQNTSVGLGYMAELFIDYGPVGMLIALLVLGVILGFAYNALQRFAPSQSFFIAMATILFVRQFSSYEEHLPKLLGGVLQGALVFCAMSYFAGRRIHVWLSSPPPQEWSELPVAEATVRSVEPA